MISDATSLPATAAAAVVIAVIGLSLLGDALRDAFDPPRGI
ncbi:MAG TPA: hypothetical protein VKF14_06680 [Candidatus Dormibacteraeota bacterium]|nr:hypothetical protein [Candidatus Dormibacteraeota bacterium]